MTGGPPVIVEPRYKWASWVGFVAHLALGVFPYAVTGLLAPIYGVAIAYVGWFGLLFVALRWWNRTPLRVLFIPVLAVVWWFALLAFGDFVLGWTA